jgi:hypothetical protein
MERTIITIRGKKMHIEYGANPSMLESKLLLNSFYGVDELWDIAFEDFLNGAMEVDEHIWYIYYEGRCYETDKCVE